MGKLANLARTGEGKEHLANMATKPKGAFPSKAAEARTASNPMSPKPVDVTQDTTAAGGGPQEPMKKMPQTPPTNSTAAQFDSNPKGAKLGGSAVNPMREQSTPAYTPSTKMLPEPKPTSKVNVKPKAQVPPTNRTDAQFKS